jgi:hypothetical protein
MLMGYPLRSRTGISTSRAPVRFNQHMAPKDNGSRSDPISAETTAALPDDHLDELHEPTSPSAEEAVSGLELPTGSALLVVTRGPNTGVCDPDNIQLELFVTPLAELAGRAIAEADLASSSC